MSATTQEQIMNKDQARGMAMKIMHLPRIGWVIKGSRAKSNEKIEMSRALAKELADKTVSFYLTLEQLPYDPFCNCKHVEALLQKAIQELPEGDTVDELQQIMFSYCSACGKKFEG
ncbi:hypothetical protein [Desulfosporosinus sp. SB140]|uniref:hypothetical protein n=1 Tax=Desulfosporosinus paludis TaxID=3115649 RepID=UPI00388D4E9B